MCIYPHIGSFRVGLQLLDMSAEQISGEPSQGKTDCFRGNRNEACDLSMFAD